MIRTSNLYRRNCQVFILQKSNDNVTINSTTLLHLYIVPFLQKFIMFVWILNFLTNFIYFLNIYACILHVLGTMIVQKLKALIQRLYKADSEIKLSYVSKKASYLKYCAKWGDNFINKQLCTVHVFKMQMQNKQKVYIFQSLLKTYKFFVMFGNYPSLK